MIMGKFLVRKVYILHTKHLLAIILLLISLSFSGCTKQCITKKKIPRKAIFEQTTFVALNAWEYDDHHKALEAFKNSCKAIYKRKSHDYVGRSTKLGGKAHQWYNVCNKAFAIKNPENPENSRVFFEENFNIYKVKDAESKKSIGKFTGYYEVEINGSRKKTKKYKHPIYRTPQNLNSIKGTHTIKHSSINNGSLNKKNLEIAWVDNKARLFFMQIQGSGVVKLDDGKEIRVGYADQNGHPYTTIGPHFSTYTKSKIESAVDMMHWLHQNPVKGQELMEKNQSYVFFKEYNYGKNSSVEGPVGAQNVHLIPGRSLAIDHEIYPHGTLFWIETKLPKTRKYNNKVEDYHRLMVGQDSGGAIKGVIRADIFFGRGDKSEEFAGYMNNLGEWYALFPKGVVVPSEYESK